MKAINADVATSLISGTIDAAQGTQPTVLIVADIDALTGTDEIAESTIDNQRVDPAVIRRLSCDSIIQTAILGENRAVGPSATPMATGTRWPFSGSPRQHHCSKPKTAPRPPLAGLGERCNPHDIADILVTNTRLRRDRAEFSSRLPRRVRANAPPDS